MPYMYGYHWIIWLGFWVLIILGIFLIVRALAGRKAGGEGVEKSALDLLNERYARGEITREEYNEKKKDILGK
ncbi:MAG: hypothetical protein A2X99_11175 [Deltaproteobacteria bacterium GWB2_55_19]|nr:MAG: hypothetical protein A2X99_11175 [Deltaproteobacteria bacterium GWB2_55_19]